MANKKFFWLKLKEDFFRDKRIKKLRRIAGGDTYTIIYLKLQLLSLKNNGALIYEGIEPTLEEELALEIDEEEDNVKVALAFMFTNGLIEETDPNHFIMTETIQCIGSESASAERVRKHRELKAQKQKALQCNTQVTNSNIEIEKEKEIELEEELEEEKKKKSAKAPIVYFSNENLNTLFNEFLEMRKKLKAVNSDRAIKMLINKLNKYDDNTKIKMLENSILNSWKDVYELKGVNNKPNNKNANTGEFDGVAEAIRKRAVVETQDASYYEDLNF